MAAPGARVIFIPPPLYYVAGLVAGALLDRMAPLPVGARPWTTLLGAVVALAGTGLAAAGIVAVVRHRTTIVPHHAVATLVTSGGYRHSRNPMYSGLALLYLGLALLLGTWWPVLLGPLVLLAVFTLVIRPEEHYLAARFGPAYTAYRGQVRRWL